MKATNEKRSAYTARQIPPDSYYYQDQWDCFKDYDFRDWEIVSWGRGGLNEHAATPIISAAMDAACNAPEYEDQMGKWLCDYLLPVYRAAHDFVKETGVKVSLPDWRSAAKAAHKYISDCDFSIGRGHLKPQADEEDAACVFLDVVTGIDWSARAIQGCSQGDYAVLICPDSYDTDFADEIEARFFGTGEAWCVEDENGEYVCDCYTWRYKGRDAQIREQITNQVCGDFDLMICEIDGETRAVSYKDGYAA